MNKNDVMQFNLKFFGNTVAGEPMCTSLDGKVKIKFTKQAWELMLKAAQSDIDSEAAARAKEAKPKVMPLRKVKK